MAQSAETVERIIALTNSGYSRKQVAEMLHISRNTVCGVVDRQRDKITVKLPEWTPIRIERVRQLAKEGNSQREIARILGSSPSRINDIIRRHCQELVGTFRHKGDAAKAEKRKHSKHLGLGNIIARNAAAVAAYVPPPAEPPTPTLCGLLELTNTTCRAPIGEPGEADFGFCGSDNGTDNAAGHPYCRYHASKFFVPVRR